MTDVVEQLREADPVQPSLWADTSEGHATRERAFGVPVRPSRRRRRALPAFVAAAAVLAIVASVLLTGESSPAPRPGAGSFVDGTWKVLPAGPARDVDPDAMLWTGNEVIVWGRAPAAYDPRARRWRLLSPPVGTAVDPVWTGSELVVWTGGGHDDEVAGAAFDPKAGSWRRIAPAPLDATAQTKVVWDGREVVVVGAMFACPPGANCPIDPVGAAAYDPGEDAWRPLPDLPVPLPVTELHNLLAVRDRDGVVVTAQTGAGNFAWRYALSAGEWVPVPTPPRAGVGVSDLVNAPGGLAYVFWKHVTGTDLRVEVVTLDRGRDAWLAGPPTPVRGICASRATAVPGGLVVRCPQPLRFFDLRANTWRRMPQPPKLVATVWTGRELFGLGVDGRHLLRYRPAR